MKHTIGITRNNVFVYVNLIHSKAGEHIAQNPHLLNLVEEALNKISLYGAELSIEYDMRRAIGYNFVISTNDKDTVFYARLLKDDVYTRFVKNGKPAPANHLALVFLRDDQGDYELLNTWIGRLSPPRPGSPNETSDSKSYWSSHAVILDKHSVQSRTITKMSPY